MLVAAAAVALLGACGSDGGRPGDEGPATAATGQSDPPPGNEVAIRLVAFKPEVVRVERGATVVWTQNDPGAHTVTSGKVDQGGAGVTATPDGRFDSGELAATETFRFTFDEAGTYPYYCAIHPATMRGEIQVA